MDDIVERLRTLYLNNRGGVADAAADGCDDAADEIERLREEVSVRLAQVETHLQANVRLEARLAEAERDAELGRIAIKFVDRAGDVCDEDTARIICAEFYNAMANAVERQREARGLPAMRITDSGTEVAR